MKQGYFVETVIILILLADTGFKLINHRAILSLKCDKNKVKSKDRELIDVLFDSDLVYFKGEPVVSSSVLLKDLLLFLFLVLAFVVEQIGYI